MISSENESIDEIKNRLLSTKLELITARKESNNAIKKYEETVKRLYKLLTRVCQERDEARNQLLLLAKNYQPSSSTTTSSSTIPQPDHHSLSLQQYNNSNQSVKSTKVSSNCYDLSLSNEKKEHGLAESSNNYLTLLPKQQKPNHQNYQHDQNNRVASSKDNNMIDRVVSGKPLPQKGRLPQSVTKAGPLLHTLLAAPLAQWTNPPPPSSSPGIQLSSIQNNKLLSANADNKASVDPTSLTLGFAGNSYGPSSEMPSSAFGSGLLVKNEPISSYANWDSNKVLNHATEVKKRKFM